MAMDEAGAGSGGSTTGSGASTSSNSRSPAARLVSSCCTDVVNGWTPSNAAMATIGMSARYTASTCPPVTSGIATASTTTAHRLVSPAASPPPRPRTTASRSPSRSTCAPNASTCARCESARSSASRSPMPAMTSMAEAWSSARTAIDATAGPRESRRVARGSTTPVRTRNARSTTARLPSNAPSSRHGEQRRQHRDDGRQHDPDREVLERVDVRDEPRQHVAGRASW